MVYSNRILLSSLVFLTEFQDFANITDLEFVFWGGFFLCVYVTKGQRAIEKICEAIPEGKPQHCV